MLPKFYNKMDLDSYMERKKMSVADLANMLGLKTAAVYNYKYGRSKPSYEVLEKLLLNGATIAELFNDQVEAALMKTLQVEKQEPLNEAEIVRRGLLELAKQIQG